VVIAGALLLTTVRPALDEADADAAAVGDSHERADAEAAVSEVPAIEEEAVLAADALQHDPA
jgi:transcription elongation GreA/GreB family factor